VLLGPRASLPLSADGIPPLFEGFTGTITWSDASETGMEAVWPDALASRSAVFVRSDSAEASRFVCRKWSTCLGSSTTRGRQRTRGSALSSVAVRRSRAASAPRWRLFDVPWPSPLMPLSTLRWPPRGAHRRTWGQMARDAFPGGLLHARLPADVARRTDFIHLA
jgi:hypothetical protein